MRHRASHAGRQLADEGHGCGSVCMFLSSQRCNVLSLDVLLEPGTGC